MARKPTENGGIGRTKKNSIAQPVAVPGPEPRKNVVPINLDEEIRRRAYELYVQRGNGQGSQYDDWITAEKEVRSRYQRDLLANAAAGR